MRTIIICFALSACLGLGSTTANAEDLSPKGESAKDKGNEEEVEELALFLGHLYQVLWEVEADLSRVESELGGLLWAPDGLAEGLFMNEPGDLHELFLEQRNELLEERAGLLANIDDVWDALEQEQL